MINPSFFKPTACTTDLIALQLKVGRGRNADSIYLCDDLPASITLVRSGFGVVLLPLIFIPEALDDIKPIPVSDCPDMSFGVYFKPNQNNVQNIFIQLLRKKLKNHAQRLNRIFSSDKTVSGK